MQGHKGVSFEIAHILELTLRLLTKTKALS